VPPFNTFAGQPLTNPVNAPTPGREAKSIRDARAADARNADELEEARGNRVGNLVLTQQSPGGAPILMRPAGHDSRPARNPRTSFFERLFPASFNEHADIGRHGELVAGANPNPGHQLPGVSQHRNTFRVPPAPWDTSYFVSPAGATEDR
jgi:hypothetical protein